MKNRTIPSLCLFLCLFLLWQCAREDPASPQPALSLNCTENPDLCVLNAANNRFGFDIFRRIQQEEPRENIFLSPMSIGAALAMTMNGADGQTGAEMRQTMRLGELDIEGVNAAYHTLLRVLPELDRSVQVRLANSIWYRRGYPVIPAFLATCEEAYDSEARESDFADPATVDAVNGWVSEKTEGRIEEIIERIDDNSIMFLINAIYFKGDWKLIFDTEKTSKQPFFLPEGGQVEVDMMNHGGIRLPYYETEEFQAVDLDYGDQGAFSMSLVLPKPGISLVTLTDRMENGAWDDWEQRFAVDSIIFGMPKFEVRYEKKLNDILIDLGMPRAFDPDFADFSRLVEGGGVYINEVRHKSFVKVDEKGTEAAAVTIVDIVVTSIPQVPFVILDRPFLYVIREKGTNAVLFIGQMMDPTR